MFNLFILNYLNIFIKIFYYVFCIIEFIFVNIILIKTLLTFFYLILYLKRFHNFFKFNIFLIIYFFLSLIMIILKKRFF